MSESDDEKISDSKSSSASNQDKNDCPTDGLYELPVRNDLSNAADIKEAILNTIAGGDQIIIDGTRVERMDTPVVQVLCAARTSLAKEDVIVRFRAPSEAMMKSFVDLGLAVEIDKWSNEQWEN